jgi:holo-[acyl-carrier protein] synthase
MTILRTGIDLIEISRLEELNPSIRQRFLERVFTPMELQQIGTSIPSLTGRFAAKEAVAKALGTGIGAISWQEIEIIRGPEGEPILTLSGHALEISRDLGLETWSISITHNRTTAAAVAVAIGGTG